ncbi:MAG: polar amino acid transport system ATP-binding protein [Paracoccaceae bacterium]|jgi:polar amino acid transport system ATP-binding protein
MKLRLENLQKSFGTNHVLRGLSLDVAEGECICLIGSSGSGKSTVLRSVNLLEPLDDGAIFLDGVDIAEPGLDPQPIRQRIGIVFQSFNLFPHMTAAGNVRLAPRRLGHASGQALNDQVGALFETFGLSQHMDHYPDQLSGGQQQRVAVIRALAMRPEIMLFDEVTSALDPELVGEVLDVMHRLRSERMTMIVATHEMAFAAEAADRVAMLDQGRIIEIGNAREVLTNPREQRTRGFLRLDRTA